MIKIICVGKLKEVYWTLAEKEYLKRLKKYSQVEIIEIVDEGISDSKVALRKEKEKIEKVLTPKEDIITLEIEGKSFNSTELSEKLEKMLIENSNLTFIIGGSYGLDPEIKKRAKVSLSFSKMTFPHQMFRIMLLEQIYRSYKIKNNESYHK